jgi:hypothetical protein
MELVDLPGRVRAAAENSDLIRAVEMVARDGGISFAIGDATLRTLSAIEIEQLESHGSIADDWTRLRVADGFLPARVRHCTFHGDVVLGRFTQRVRFAPGLELPTGIYHSTLANCVVGHETLVRNVGLLLNYVIAGAAIISDCGSVTCDAATSFGNGQELSVAIETGGRDLAVFAEIDVELARIAARTRSQPDALKRYADSVAEYSSRCKSARGIVETKADLRHTPVVRNTYVGPHVQINAATIVADSTLLSSNEEPVHINSGACVARSLLQWGSHAATMAIVDSSVLTEHSHVERHGKVTASIVGPNSGVAEGEVTACLLGPFVGFHHQALLIAAFWPEGKGNVGYGANVGSNHTSKAPDQEFWPGEGAFFGLGVNIKYPADFSRAPYTIIASGVTTLPQRITFPFSLINRPGASMPEISPAYNEIMPAWVLIDNMFTLKRNEGKYKARNRAKRTAFDFDVFRPEIVDLMIDASQRLQIVGRKELYTDRDIEGLGKNYMSERSRVAAIDAYKFYVKYYGLMGLFESVRRNRHRPAAEEQREAGSPDLQRWEHQRRILIGMLGISDALAGLRELPQILERVAGDVERSKAKDDERGLRIIDDYLDVHEPASKDKFVRQTWEETRRIQHEVEALIADWSRYAYDDLGKK